MHFLYFDFDQSHLHYSPNSSFNADNNNSYRSRRDMKRLMKLSFILIFICICFIIPIYLRESINLVDSSGKNYSLVEYVIQYFNTKLDYSAFRYLDSDDNFTQFYNLTGIYSGNWYNITDQSNKGKIYFRAANQKDLKGINAFVKIIHGLHIDRWTFLTCVGRQMTVTHNKSDSHSNNNGIHVNASFLMGIESGENFEKQKIERRDCRAEMNLFFYNQTNDVSRFNNIKGNLTSECFVNISFEISIDDSMKYYKTIIFYSFLTSLISVSATVNSFWTLKQVNNSAVNGNAISMMTVAENIIWNAYGCLYHSFLYWSYSDYLVWFAFPAFLYFINFSIMDSRLLYILWSKKHHIENQDPSVLRLKLLQFYFVFYFVLFISLFFVLKFYFSKNYIIAGFLFMWTPQILYNVKENNRVSLPLVFLIVTSLNRIFPTLYFRGYSKNFFEFSTDYHLIAFCFIILTLSTLLLYSQTFWGPRWFLPKKYRRKGFDFYKTEEEVRNFRNDADTLDCLICLCPLIPNSKEKITSSIELPSCVNAVANQSQDSVLSVGEDIKLMSGNKLKESDLSVVDTSKMKSKYKLSLKKLLKKILKNLIEFHEGSENIYNKPLMMTPCHHIFHSECLESWFKMKKECPNCRAELSLNSSSLY